MKPSFLLLLCLLMGSMATAQIELEHSYPGAANQASTGFSQLSLAPLEVSGCKYAWVDKKNHKVSLYDLGIEYSRPLPFPTPPLRSVDTTKCCSSPKSSLTMTPR
jgi:hypothetical protein